MADNQRSWWQQWTDTTYIKPLNRLRAAQEPYRREEQVLINRRDITSRKDAWDMQEFITRMYVKQLLRHPASKVLLAVLLVVNAITIALRTNSMLGQVDDRKGNGNNKLPLVHCAVARSEMSGVPQEPFMGGSLTNLSERTCDNFCLVLEAIQENLMQYKEIRAELNTIVDEVRSIRFNQEQEEELMQRYLSWNMSLESRSSVDIREMTREQDLITALVNRKKVQESNTNVNKRKASR